MDIVQTLQIKIQSLMHEKTFDINSALSNPTEEASLLRLEKAVAEYAALSEQLNTLNRLSQQMQENQEKPVDN